MWAVSSLCNILPVVVWQSQLMNREEETPDWMCERSVWGPENTNKGARSTEATLFAKARRGEADIIDLLLSVLR